MSNGKRETKEAKRETKKTRKCHFEEVFDGAI